MLEEIKNGAHLEFELGDEENPPAFMLVWYDPNEEVEFARLVGFREINNFLTAIYSEEEILEALRQDLGLD